MQRRRLSKRVPKMVWMCISCCALLVAISGFAHAQDADTVPFSEATRLVNGEYIPHARAAMGRRGHAELAAQWEGATAGQPLLQYQLVRSEAVGYEVVARYVLVPVEHDGKLVGLIGLDPFTGEFGWRLDHVLADDLVSAVAGLPLPPDHRQLSASIAQAGESHTAFRLQDVRLVYAGGQNYWYVPARNGGVSPGLFVPVGKGAPLRVDELGLAAGQAGFVIEPNPLPSSPVERLDPLPGTSDGGRRMPLPSDGGRRMPLPSDGLDITGAAAPTSAVTWMVDDIPYYKQDCDLWCWAASLSMLHQWWSPVRLGNSYDQQSEIVRYVKGRVVCAGGSADEIHRVVKNWHGVNGDYESFQTSYKGQGKAFAAGNPSGYNDDPKTWLSYLQAPVIAFVDTSANGKANHAILIIGYDDHDSGGVVYVHDPWYSNWWPGHGGERMSELALSYALFDRKWNVTWEGQLFSAPRGLTASPRRGMVAGIPGDNRFSEVNNTTIHLSGTIYDDEMERVFDLGMGALYDDTAAQHDSFGQTYENGVLVELTDAAQGDISLPVGAGDFGSYNPAPPSSYISFQTHSIPEDGQRDGASFHVDPKVLGNIELQTTWWVHDQDDRWHYDAQVSVLDDRGGSNTPLSMPKPTLARDSHGPTTNSFQVQDDDAAGPSVTDHTDSADATPGTYSFKIRLSDPSGILDDAEYPRIYFRWDSEEIDSTLHDGYLNAEWDGSWYVAAMTVGLDRVGHTLYWRALAYDGDDDREDDGTAAWSSAYRGGTITEGTVPSPPMDVQASDGTYSGRVHVTWNALANASSYQVHRASSPSDSKDKIGNPNGASFDDTSAAVDTTYYYWVKACNPYGCSDFSDYDTGYHQDTVPPEVTVNSPNGGENWQIDSKHTIAWSATDDAGVTSISLFYSTNGGSTWKTIASGETNDGSYRWTIPDGPSTSCRVKVKATDGAGNAGEDVSDASFTISKGPLIVISTHPLDNGLEVAPSEMISTTFSRAVDDGTVSARTFAVRGRQTGVYQGTYAHDGDSIQFDAGNDFRPGEEIVVSLSHGIRAPDGTPLVPYAWQFRSAVSDGSGIFDSGQNLGNSYSFAVALGDLDGDRDLDAFVGNNGLPNKVWLNNGGVQSGTPGEFSDSGQTLGNSQTFAAALGDLDGDGDLDAFVANSGNQPNKVWLNDGTGDFGDSPRSLGSDKSTAVALGDLDGDGDLDAFVTNDGQANRVWLNDGGAQGGTPGEFTDSGQRLGSSFSYGVALGDLDSDGDLDALVANVSTQANRVWINDGGAQGGTLGVFSSGQPLGSSSSVGVALGDVDRDGDLDALVANLRGDQANKVWLNDGGVQGGTLGHFTDSGQSLGLYQSWAVALGDLDGDGDLDAFIANINSQPDRVWLNDGGDQGGTPGRFSDSGQSLAAPSSQEMTLDELDGAQGLAALSGRLGTLGDLDSSQSLAATPSSRAVSLGDVDGDGDLDAFVGISPVANKVWLNRDTTEPCYGLSTSADPTGSGSVVIITAPNCTGGKYTRGTEVQIRADANSDWGFDQWSDDAAGCGSNRDCTVTMDSDRSVTARFVPRERARVQVGSGELAPDGTVTIPVEALNVAVPGLGAATIEVHYDPVVVEVQTCTSNPANDFDVVLCHDDGSRVRLTAVAAPGAPGDSLLAEITFHAVGWHGDHTMLDVDVITFADPSGDPIDVAEQDGEITIGAADGDVSCDGKTNAVDALFILQREVGLRPNDSDTCPPPSDGLHLPACDVSGDSDCSSVDAMLILQREVGPPNTLGPGSGSAMSSGQAPAAPQQGSPMGPGPLDDVTLTIGSGDVEPGDTITVPLTANLGSETLGAATIQVQYDPAVLDAISCTADPSGVSDLALCNVNLAADRVGLTIIAAAGVSGDAVLAQITFQAVGPEGDSSALALTADPFSDPAGDAIDVITQNGQVTIIESTDHHAYLPLTLRE